MSSQSFVIGHETAPPLRPFSPIAAVDNSQLSTVMDLLNAIDPSRPKRFPMLWTTVSHLSECANMAMSEMSIAMLRQVAPEYEIWLKGRRYSSKSVSTFMYNLRRLIERADEMGCTEINRSLIDAWKPLAEALKKVRLAPRTVPQFAISRGKFPADFTEEDLKSWADWMVRRGRKHRTVRIEKGRFKRAVRKAELEHLLPRFSCDRVFSTYGIPTSEMPEPLQTQVKKLLVWKQAKFVKGRPQKTRHRAVSARLLENIISRLYGFAVRVGGWKDITTLPGLFCEEVVSAFTEWAINERDLSRGSLLRLSMIYGALRHHPEYKHHDYSWFSDLCDLLPEDDKSGREARKARKKVDYETLSRVPEKIRSSFKGKIDSVESCWLVHDQLLISWITTLVWRQRNIRECRLGSPGNANLFFAPLDRFVHIARPAWVEEMLKVNQEQCVWQFHFTKEQTKTDHEVRGIVPQHLISLLEQYLFQCRPKLVSAQDPKTLFLNRDGGALDQQSTTELVAELTLRYTGVRVTPHVIRDVFAYAWLSAHPEDFLTLSKVLWHRSLRYTLQVYGADYDESNAVCRIDEWLRAPK